MKKIFAYFSVLMVCIIILTSCWSSRELNELAIAMALGIDKSEEEYLVTVQLINPGEIKEATIRAPVTTYSISGKSIFETLRRLTLQAPRKIYLAHLRLLILGEKLAKEDGIKNVLDFFYRNHEVRPDFYIMVAKNTKAKEVLSILTPLEQIPTNKHFSALEISQELWAPTHHIQPDELISTMVSEGKEPVITGIIIKGPPEIGQIIKNIQEVDVPTTVQIHHLAVFKNNKLIGWLNEEESIGYNHIIGEVKRTVGTCYLKECGKISIELVQTKVKVKGQIKNGKPKIEIKYLVDGNIGDIECKINLLDEKNIRKIEDIVEKEIKRKMNLAIKKGKYLQSDIFGFGEIIHRSNPKAWKKLKKDWNKRLKNLEIDIKVTAKIKHLGTIMDPFQNEIKK